MTKSNQRNPIKNVCFIGGGTMGCYNAFIAALAGYTVTIFDPQEATLALIPSRQKEFADIFIANGLYNEALLLQAIESITRTSELTKAVAKADLVSESVFEQLDIKRNVHQQLDKICPEHTILTTNSSGLLVSDIEDVVERGERFAALHTHLLSPLVDIVAGPRTSPEIMVLLKHYVESLGAVPLVLKKENPGYVLNTMISKLLSTAMLLMVDDDINFKTIDSAWMEHTQSSMGPFGMIDMFGLDITHYGLQIEEPNGRMKAVKAKLSPVIQHFIERGFLGVKTGQGFYQYPKPKFAEQDFILSNKNDDSYRPINNRQKQKRQSAFIYQRLVASIIIAAILLAENGIVEQQDVDKAWVVGMMLLKGPFVLLNEVFINKQAMAVFNQTVEEFVNAGSILPSDAQQISCYLNKSVV